MNPGMKKIASRISDWKSKEPIDTDKEPVVKNPKQTIAIAMAEKNKKGLLK